MPLFGRKEKNSSAATANSSGKPAYPTQAMAPYPTQSCGNPYPELQNAGLAPPPYSAVVQPNNASYGPVAAPQNQVTGPPMYTSPYPQPRMVVVQGGFDAGARFDSNAKPAIPPPPPGCALHPAQMAAYQGNNVVVTQRQGDFWSGGSDGGYTLF